jgi:hypothetical protein
MATVTPALGAHGHADDHAHGHHEQTFISKVRIFHRPQGHWDSVPCDHAC